MSSDEAVAYPTQTVVACEVCGVTMDVIWYCKNCPGSLCSSCKDDHKTTNITSKHSVVPRTGNVVRSHGPAKIAEQCRIHPEKEISAYCNKCEVACCISCLAENHKQHDFSPIDEKYLAAEKRLNDYTKQLEKGVMPKLDEIATQIRADTKDDEQKRENVKEEVNAFREEMKQAVDEACDTLIDTLYQSKSELDYNLQNIEKKRKKVSDMIQSCSDKVREGKLTIIEYNPPEASSFLPTPTTSMLSRPVFVPGREVLDFIRKNKGCITYKNVKQQTHVASSERLSHSTPNFDKSSIDVKKLTSFNSRIRAMSITTAGNNTAWVMDDHSDTMYLYSESREVVRSVTVVKGVGINYIVITPSGDMVVNMCDMKVRCVSVGGEVSTLIDTAPFDAVGVCMTDRGEIVVCMTSQGKMNHVAVYSSDGRRKLREVRCQDVQGKQYLNCPYRVVQNGEDLCVVNFGSNVVCVDDRGDVRWVYDGTQAKLKNPFNPYGVCKDKYNNLLITDNKNNCVHYIDREGQLIQIILTYEQIGLRRHWEVSVDDDTGQVWVGNFFYLTGNIAIAKYIKF